MDRAIVQAVRDGDFEPLSGLPWYGGKSYHSPTGTGRWIASLLPQTQRCTYVEVCGGMGGILLQRRPAEREIFNDLNGDVCNFWATLRAEPDHFGRLIACTPQSRMLYEHCVKKLLAGTPPLTIEEMPDLRRAWVWFVRVISSFTSTDNLKRGNAWAATKSYQPWVGDKVAKLASRFRDVRLECQDASVILERIAGRRRYIVYVDPPYQSARTHPYRYEEIDRPRLGATLKEQKGRVAISGYGDEWDSLGWVRNEYDTFLQAMGRLDGSRPPRTEVLWTNYQPERGLL